jgi:3-hydroxyacyl-[acyl-carrier-protein] dehydratase
MTQKILLNINDIMDLIPHRYPFLFMDYVEDIVVGESIKAVKMVSINEWFFQGHFPHQPIMPGVLIIEALAQTAAVLAQYSARLNNQKESGLTGKELVYFMSITEAKFRQPVLPGDKLELYVHKERQRGNVWKFRGGAIVNGKITDEALFTAMIAK